MYCCSTARSNKYPAVLKGVHLDRGKHNSQIVGNVHCFVWKDKKTIDFIQTVCHSSVSGTVKRKTKDGSHTVVSCLLPVKIYNKKMGGMDLAV